MNLTHFNQHGQVWLFALLFLLWVSGCASSGPTPAAGGRVVDVREALSGPYEVVDIARAEVLMPLPVPQGQVRVTDYQGVAHEKTDQTKALGEGTWRMRVPGFWVVDVVREADGEISILREVELGESRRVEYDPPLAMLPSALVMGEPTQRVSVVRLYDHDSGQLQASGTCTAVYRLLGTKPLALPGELSWDTSMDTSGGASGGKSGGSVTAYIVQTDRRFDLPWVKVDMQILSGYVPGEGAVAGWTRRDMKLLGVLPVSREESVVRVRRGR